MSTGAAENIYARNFADFEVESRAEERGGEEEENKRGTRNNGEVSRPSSRGRFRMSLC